MEMVRDQSALIVQPSAMDQFPDCRPVVHHRGVGAATMDKHADN